MRGTPRPLKGDYFKAEYSQKETVVSKSLLKVRALICCFSSILSPKEVWRYRTISTKKTTKKEQEEQGKVKHDQSFGRWKQGKQQH